MRAPATAAREAVEGKDYLGDPMPAGYRKWFCDICTAGCNFEAMMLCNRPIESCPVFIENPESNHGCFAFIKRMSPEERRLYDIQEEK